MYKVTSNHIFMIRGDTVKLKIKFTDKIGKPLQLFPTDRVIFTLKRTSRDCDILLQRDFTDGSLQIDPDDTNFLDFGRYVYDVQLIRADGFVDTIVTPHQFNIMEEVNY